MLSVFRLNLVLTFLFSFQRKRFPAETKAYLLPDGKTINRNPSLVHVATRRAAEMELVYGRGETQVRHERPVYPEDALEAEDADQLVLVGGRSMEFLQSVFTQLKTYKIESQEESRLVKATIDLLSDALIDFRVQANNAGQ